MLVGRGHQTGQPHEVFFARLRVVDAGVSGMGCRYSIASRTAVL